MVEETKVNKQMESVLQSEYQLYQRLLNLSDQQHALLLEKEPDTEKIAGLMDQKVALISDIQILEERHRPIRREWDQEYETFPEQERQGVANWKELLSNTLEKLQVLEDKIIELIQHCERDVSDQLRRIYQGRAIHRAYFRLEQSPAKFINKKK